MAGPVDALAGGLVAGKSRMIKFQGYLLVAAIVLALIGGTIVTFWDVPGEKTHFNPVVP